MLPLLAVAGGLLLLVAVFAVCRWGGATLATHHNDAREVSATASIGLCVLAAVAILPRAGLPGGPLALLLVAVAVGGGLFAGYLREE